MAENVPDDRALDNRIRRKGSRYALWAAITIAAILVGVMAAYMFVR